MIGHCDHKYRVIAINDDKECFVLRAYSVILERNGMRLLESARFRPSFPPSTHWPLEDIPHCLLFKPSCEENTVRLHRPCVECTDAPILPHLYHIWPHCLYLRSSFGTAHLHSLTSTLLFLPLRLVLFTLIASWQGFLVIFRHSHSPRSSWAKGHHSTRITRRQGGGVPVGGFQRFSTALCASTRMLLFANCKFHCHRCRCCK
jgi:hypothetical protein